MNKKETDGALALTMKAGDILQVDDVSILFKQVSGSGIGKAVKIVVVAPKTKKVSRLKEKQSDA